MDGRECAPNGQRRTVAIVVSRFNETVTTKLLDGALQALTRHGAAYDDIDVVWVPGAWELPAAARFLLASERYHALVAVGAVIRGETAHFDYIANEASRGLADASAEFDTPIGFGVLTCDTEEQALDRAGLENSSESKGYEATAAALQTARTLREINS